MASSRTDIGRSDQQMGRDPFHPAVQPLAQNHASEGREPEARTEQSNKAPIVEAAQQVSALSRAQFGRDESGRVTAFTTWIDRGRQIWRGHVRRDQLPETTEGSRGNVERWWLALLSVAVLVSCVCATIVFTQLKSLKGEIATLQREIIALKLRVARLDQIASANEARDNAPRSPARTHPDQASLSLSREEIQLIRDYIKPAPVAGAATESIKVGDPVTGETIPFPSPITDKVRKLLGARFTIRNGVIVITGNGSHYADAVIGPN
jgi:hypothetical protein